MSVCESIYYCAKSVYFYHYNQENIGSHFVVNNPLNFVCALKFIKEYLVKEHVKEIDILYGNAMVEYMILLMFQITRMQNIYSYISWKNSYNAINVLLQNQSGENNLSYYKQKHNDNFKIIPFLVKHKLVLFIIIVFKIQISLHKWRR